MNKDSFCKRCVLISSRAYAIQNARIKCTANVTQRLLQCACLERVCYFNLHRHIHSVVV